MIYSTTQEMAVSCSNGNAQLPRDKKQSPTCVYRAKPSLRRKVPNSKLVDCQYPSGNEYLAHKTAPQSHTAWIIT